MSGWLYLERVKKNIMEERMVLDINIKRCIDISWVEEGKKIILAGRAM